MKVKYPLATVMAYGPDDRTVTKLVVGIQRSAQDDPDAIEVERWVGTKVAEDPRVAKEMYAFMKAHGAKTVLTATAIMGCPHEEGEDFPEGGDCPLCPFWKGMQGSGTSDERWDRQKSPRVEKLGFFYKFWLPEL